MARFRQLFCEFWQDGFVSDLTPEEKFFYVYILTNPRTKQCGCYEITIKQVAVDTGYNHETVVKLIARFQEYDKIIYDERTKELFVINWLKYNLTKSPKVIACVRKETEFIKNSDFKRRISRQLTEIQKKSDRVCIDLGEEEEREEEREVKHSASDDAQVADDAPFYETKKGHKLTGRKLELFNRFWEAFDRKKGKPAAAEVFYRLKLTNSGYEDLIAGAAREAARRPALESRGLTPIYPEGWLSGRRWEDEDTGPATQSGGVSEIMAGAI